MTRSSTPSWLMDSPQRNGAEGATGEQVSALVAKICQTHAHAPERLLEMLHDIQDQWSYLTPDALQALSVEMSLPISKISSVASFYHLLSLQPVGRYRVLFSDNVTDRMLGSDALMDALCRALWITPGRLSEDALVSVARTSCTGMCDQGPALLVNGQPITRVDHARIAQMAELIRAQVPVSDWPAEWFAVQDQIRHEGPLLQACVQAGTATQAVQAMGPEAFLTQLADSGLRGRGGAGFPTATKWRACRDASLRAGQTRVVVCNADEGEPGTFKDRVLLSRQADAVIEGMCIAATVLDASQGFIYLRAEYRYLRDALQAKLTERRAAGLLGRGFDIEIRLGAGAYVCGEESALIESLEGKRGTPRLRPPYPVTSGYLGQPTVVNNVETYCCVAWIAQHGAAAFRAWGTAESSGSKLLSVSGDCARPGIYELPLGCTVAEVLQRCGASDTQAVQISGASGVTLASHEFGRRIGFEDLPTAGAFMVFDQSRDMFEIARQFTAFFVHESCGFCTPCRVGLPVVSQTLDKMARGSGSPADVEEIEALNHLLQRHSHCGLGQAACHPVLHTFQKFPLSVHARLAHQAFVPAFDLDHALQAARLMTGRDDAAAHGRDAASEPIATRSES